MSILRLSSSASSAASRSRLAASAAEMPGAEGPCVVKRWRNCATSTAKAFTSARSFLRKPTCSSPSSSVLTSARSKSLVHLRRSTAVVSISSCDMAPGGSRRSSIAYISMTGVISPSTLLSRSRTSFSTAIV